MILIYINATSMTCIGIMTLCKHRLALTGALYVATRQSRSPVPTNSISSTLRCRYTLDGYYSNNGFNSDIGLCQICLYEYIWTFVREYVRYSFV